MGNELFDLVLKAQNGDKEAMYRIIDIISPAIRSARNSTKQDLRDDLEQTIVEMIIKKTLSYNVFATPDFSAFCQQLDNSGKPFKP